jgi:pimeloyl-ACP methyl ester carboxylesterase
MADFLTGMGFLLDRIAVIATYVAELVPHGIPVSVGPVEHEVVFILDGVGGFQFVPLMVRRALRENGVAIGTIVYRWQFGLPAEICTDLIWHRRNRLMAARLARAILAFRRDHPRAVLHILGHSGGAAIAVWACEFLRGRGAVTTLVLLGPALSPTYDLRRALRSVQRCYAMVSRRDRWMLGAGTRIFGTMDRRFCSAAGRVGFRPPTALSSEDRSAYDRLREIHWTPLLERDGHHGGHTGWARVSFLRRHLLPILHGEPALKPSSPW